jgi:hypothetical protein
MHCCWRVMLVSHSQRSRPADRRQNQNPSP